VDTPRTAKDAEVWEKVIAKLSAGEMPPPGLPRPDPVTSQAFLSWLKTSLDGAAKASPNPGRVPVHRLNQAEYTNAIRDLLALNVDAQSLLIPDDSDQNGFDNIAGALSVSPALLDRYVSAANKISRLAVGDTHASPSFDTYDIPKMMVQEDRASEDLPFGTRGGTAVHHYFPVDGDYIIRVRLRKQLYGYILGLGRAQQIDVRLDDRRIKLFTIDGEAPGKPVPNTYAADIPMIRNGKSTCIPLTGLWMCGLRESRPAYVGYLIRAPVQGTRRGAPAARSRQSPGDRSTVRWRCRGRKCRGWRPLQYRRSRRHAQPAQNL
jgi:hypothetical protein